MSDVSATLQPLLECLAALEIPYRIGGSLASSAHGLPRSSQDVDVIALVRPEHVAPLAARLQADYYLELDAVREAVEGRSAFNLIHLETMLKVDIFVRAGSPYEDEELRRRRRESLPGGAQGNEVWLASPEDTVLAKLGWYRLGGEISDQQWRDVLGVITIQAGALDIPFLRRWAAEFGTTDLLERALQEAGLTPDSDATSGGEHAI